MEHQKSNSTLTNGLLDKAFAKRKQAQLDTQTTLENTINQCLNDGRRAAVRIRKRSETENRE